MCLLGLKFVPTPVHLKLPAKCWKGQWAGARAEAEHSVSAHSPSVLLTCIPRKRSTYSIPPIPYPSLSSGRSLFAGLERATHLMTNYFSIDCRPGSEQVLSNTDCLCTKMTGLEESFHGLVPCPAHSVMLPCSPGSILNRDQK